MTPNHTCAVVWWYWYDNGPATQRRIAAVQRVNDDPPEYVVQWPPDRHPGSDLVPLMFTKVRWLEPVSYPGDAVGEPKNNVGGDSEGAKHDWFDSGMLKGLLSCRNCGFVQNQKNRDAACKYPDGVRVGPRGGETKNISGGDVEGARCVLRCETCNHLLSDKPITYSCAVAPVDVLVCSERCGKAWVKKCERGETQGGEAAPGPAAPSQIRGVPPGPPGSESLADPAARARVRAAEHRRVDEDVRHSGRRRSRGRGGRRPPR